MKYAALLTTLLLFPAFNLIADSNESGISPLIEETDDLFSHKWELIRLVIGPCVEVLMTEFGPEESYMKSEKRTLAYRYTNVFHESDGRVHPAAIAALMPQVYGLKPEERQAVYDRLAEQCIIFHSGVLRDLQAGQDIESELKRIEFIE